MFNSTRRKVMEMVNEFDDSRLIINTSGPLVEGVTDIEHIKP